MTNADTKAFWAAMGVPEPELPTYDDAGVDLTVIRWMLAMSPAERLAVLQDFSNLIAGARNARATDPLPRDA